MRTHIQITDQLPNAPTRERTHMHPHAPKYTSTHTHIYTRTCTCVPSIYVTPQVEYAASYGKANAAGERVVLLCLALTSNPYPIRSSHACETSPNDHMSSGRFVLPFAVCTRPSSPPTRTRAHAHSCTQAIIHPIHTRVYCTRSRKTDYPHPDLFQMGSVSRFNYLHPVPFDPDTNSFDTDTAKKNKADKGMHSQPHTHTHTHTLTHAHLQ